MSGTTPDYPFTGQIPPQFAIKYDCLRRLAKVADLCILQLSFDLPVFWSAIIGCLRSRRLEVRILSGILHGAEGFTHFWRIPTLRSVPLFVPLFCPRPLALTRFFASQRTSGCIQDCFRFDFVLLSSVCFSISSCANCLVIFSPRFARLIASLIAPGAGGFFSLDPRCFVAQPSQTMLIVQTDRASQDPSRTHLPFRRLDGRSNNSTWFVSDSWLWDLRFLRPIHRK